MNPSDSQESSGLGRSATVDFLIADYGNYLGLEGLAFDEDNQIVLSVDGTELVIEYVEAGGGILFQAMVGEVPEDYSAEPMMVLNALNSQIFRTGGGIVFLSPESSQLIWCDRLSLDGITLEMFDEAVKMAADQASKWAEILVSAFSQEVESSEAENHNFLRV